MKRIVSNIDLVVILCVGFLFFANYLAADEVDNTVEELLNEGVSSTIVDDLLSSDLPSDTLGTRVQDALHNGSITQRQYDKIYNNFLSLPDERRMAIKNAYEKGYAEKVYNNLHGLVNQKLGDDASVREHAHELRQQGLTKDQIVERLKNEGASPDHIKDLKFDSEEDASRPEHAKDIRATDTPDAQHKVDEAHEKKQDIKKEPSKSGQVKDIHPGEETREYGKEKRDFRKKEGQDKGVRDHGAGRGRDGVGQGGLRRKQ